MSNRFATTGGTITGIIGIIGTTGVMAGTTPDPPLLERLSVSWERPRRVLRTATPMVTISPMVTINPMVTISPMAMGAGSAARPRREFAIAHVPWFAAQRLPPLAGEAGVTARRCFKESSSPHPQRRFLFVQRVRKDCALRRAPGFPAIADAPTTLPRTFFNAQNNDCRFG